MPQINYLQPVNQSKIRVDFETILTFDRDTLAMFFPDAELIGPVKTQAAGLPVWLTGLVCTEAQWAKFTQFRRDAEPKDSEMYQRVDLELTEFLCYASMVNPGGPCVVA